MSNYVWSTNNWNSNTHTSSKASTHTSTNVNNASNGTVQV
jgi:hypothetical protein